MNVYRIRSRTINPCLSCRRFHTTNSQYKEPHPILQSKSLQHWFKNWQDLRRHKLTASTFPSALGFWHNRRVQLWEEKLGVIKPFTGNISTCYSTIKEEEALERYKIITGNLVSFEKFKVHNKMNWLGASPDGLVNDFFFGLSSQGVLEIKCPFFDGDMTNAFPFKRLPVYYIPQAQGLMEIMDKDWMDLYCWTCKGSSLFRVNRDREYWEILERALNDFWWNHVEPARELCKKSVIINTRSKEFRLLKPHPKHESFRNIIYGSTRIKNNSKLLIREIRGVLQMPETYGASNWKDDW